MEHYADDISFGDYASGTNHTLPTNGYTRQFSGVNTEAFQKHLMSQQATIDANRWPHCCYPGRL